MSGRRTALAHAVELDYYGNYHGPHVVFTVTDGEASTLYIQYLGWVEAHLPRDELIDHLCNHAGPRTAIKTFPAGRAPLKLVPNSQPTPRRASAFWRKVWDRTGAKLLKTKKLPEDS